MMSIAEKIAELDKQKTKLLAHQEKIRANKTFICVCGERHRIKECDAIQTHWYTSPHGCTGGDYWNSGHIHIVCPTTEIRNRILFNDFDTPWELRDHYVHNPEMQFKSMYKHLFREVIDTYSEENNYEWENNYYFDQKRKKFDLCEKNGKR